MKVSTSTGINSQRDSAEGLNLNFNFNFNFNFNLKTLP